MQGLLRRMAVSGDTADEDWDPESLPEDIAHTQFVPGLCQATMDLMREPGVCISVESTLMTLDDVMEFRTFGRESDDDTVWIRQVIPLASAAAVGTMERVRDCACVTDNVS